MPDKKLTQLTEIGTVDSGYYTYVVKGSDSTQYKAPLKAFDAFIAAGQTGSTLNTKINTLSGYTNATFGTITNLAATGSNLQTQITNLNTTQFVHVTGNELVSGIKYFTNNLKTDIISGYTTTGYSFNISNGGIYKETDKIIDLNSLLNSAGTPSVDWANRNLYDNAALLSLDWNLRRFYDDIGSQSIGWNGRNLIDSSNVPTLYWQQGLCFHPIQGTTIDWFNRTLYGNWKINNSSGYVTGQVIRPSDTGQFYPLSNPSGYLTGLSTGSFISVSQTGQFYPAVGNPSGFVTGLVIRPSDTGRFLSQYSTGLLDTSGIRRLKFDTLSTAIADKNGNNRFLFDTNGNYVYDAGGNLRQIIGSSNTTLFSEANYNFFYDAGNTIIIGDVDGNFGGGTLSINYAAAPASVNFGGCDVTFGGKILVPYGGYFDAYLNKWFANDGLGHSWAVNNSDGSSVLIAANKQAYGQNRVGINTSSPLYHLDVNGSGIFRSGLHSTEIRKSGNSLNIMPQAALFASLNYR